MQLRLFRLRFRRRLHKSQKQVEDIGLHAEANLERHFFKRLGSLGKVWRFISAWILLLVILISCVAVQIQALSNHYQTLQPIAGGTYNEGVLGTFTNANPIYATGEVNSTIASLVFSGLFSYNAQNQLVGNLAQDYTVDAQGTTYTVHLKPNLTWQDGKPLTADDVAFTYHEIQDPDVQSPLLSSWQGITVTKVDNLTVSFTLPNPLSSFPYTLTNGIIPEHILASVPVSDFRSADFNTLHPIGSGPFAWSELQVENSNPSNTQVLIALRPFTGYVGGAPKIDSFVVKAYVNKDQLISAFRKQQVNSIDGLSDLPASVASVKNVQQYNMLLTAATMAFFNTTSPILGDVNVRRALIQGTDTTSILQALNYATRAVHEPLLNGQLGYDPTEQQAPYNLTQAEATLTQAGWLVGTDGVRTKGAQRLEFSLYASATDENTKVTRLLASYWKLLGAKVDVHLQNTTDLQTTVSSHDYDALLYGISIGVDPDVFVYWDSSQIDPRSTRLNFSLYRSTIADAALESGRTRLDPALRIIKYKPFLAAWQQDAPALGLYQPRFLYVTNEKVYGLDVSTINTTTDRFNNVQNWMVRTTKVTND